MRVTPRRALTRARARTRAQTMTHAHANDSLALRWCVNSTTWNPDDEEFNFVLGLLPVREREGVTRFKHVADRKRAVLSRLWVRCAILRALASVEGAKNKLRMEDLDVKRTKGAKPFYAASLASASAPNFNFNVSHEGDYVVLASETHAVVGVDVAAPGQVRAIGGNGSVERDVEALLRTFTSTLADGEIAAIRAKTARDGERAGEDLFRRHWSLKEAMVKAIGVGLAMDLRRCEFAIDEATSTARVTLDGQPRDDWSFHMQAFPPIVDSSGIRSDTHWITVSRGPISDIVDANGEFLNAAFSRRQFDAEAWRRILDQPSPPFELITVGDLIPNEHKDAFEAAGGALF